MSTKSPPSPYQQIKLIPEGGWGWVICAAAFLSQFVILGINNSFGILFTFLLDEFGKSKAATAWVGSASVGVLYLFGPITCGLNERFGFRKISFIGGVLCVLGMLLTSFVTEFSKIYITYSLLWGIGSSLCYFSTLTVPGDYFCCRLSLVNGIITAGSGCGTLTFGLLLQYFLKHYGLVMTLRVLAGIVCILMATSLSYKPFRSPLGHLDDIKKVPGPFLNLKVWKNKRFVIYTLAVSLFMLGYFIPYVHIVSLVIDLGISASNGAMLIGYMSISSTVSRIIFGRFSDHPRVNRLYVTQTAILGFGITTALCSRAKTYSAFVAVMVTLGLFDGMYVALIAVVVTDIVGVHKLNQALGNLYGVISVAITIGPPFAGLIYDALLSYNIAFYTCGVITAISSLLMFYIPWIKSNNNEGRFPRDSVDSRIAFLLTSLSTRRNSITINPRALETGENCRNEKENVEGPRFYEDSCEEQAKDVEEDYLKNFHGDEHVEFSREDNSSNTFKNTACNSSMYHCDPIAKHLLSVHQDGCRIESSISSSTWQDLNSNNAETRCSSRNQSPSTGTNSMKTEKKEKIGESSKVETIV